MDARPPCGGAQEWTDPLGNTLRLEVAAGDAPHLAASDLSALREWCRRDAARGDGSIVSVDLVEVRGRQALQIVDKFERRPSYDYEGILILPLRDAHCRVVVRASEHGMTGIREAVITSHLVSLGELDTLRLASAAEEGRTGHEMSAGAVGMLLLRMGRLADAQTGGREATRRPR